MRTRGIVWHLNDRGCCAAAGVLGALQMHDAARPCAVGGTGRDGDDVSTQYRTLYGPDVGPDYGDFFTSDWDTMHLHYTHSI